MVTFVTFFLNSRLVIMTIELVTYTFVFNNFHLVTLPWDSPWTWYLCFLGVDFGYYWFHRAAHGKYLQLHSGFVIP